MRPAGELLPDLPALEDLSKHFVNAGLMRQRAGGNVCSADSGWQGHTQLNQPFVGYAVLRPLCMQGACSGV